jgi:prevent-host-death family protein
MTKKVSAYKLRTNLGELMNEVYYKGIEVVVERRGKPMMRLTRVREERENVDEPLLKLVGVLGEKRAGKLEKNIADLWKRPGFKSKEVAKALENL